MKKLLCAILISALLLTLFNFSFAASGEITNLTVSGTANAASYAVGGAFAEGAVIWTDRSWETVSCVIDEMKGATIIKTNFADKEITADNMISFNVTENAAVYVYVNYEAQSGVIPWAQDWEYIGTFETVNNSSIRTMHTYKKLYPAGSTVVLGGSGAYSNIMYGVAVDLDNVYVPVVPAITNLTVTETTNTASYAVGGEFTQGAVIWSDRSWETVNTVPEGMEGAKIIKTHYGDAKFAGTVSFDINMNSEVYVYMNYPTGDYAISWAKEWTYVGEFETINGTSVRKMYAYKKIFPAGSTVTLAEAGSGSNLMYGIAVVMDENIEIPVAPIVPEITNLIVTETTNTASYTVGGEFAQGAVIWTDRNWETVTETLASIDGAQLIQTYSADGNSDNRDTEKDNMSFDINHRAEVYVLTNFEAGPYSTPFALGWKYEGTFKTSTRTMYVYKRTYQAGSKVVLGGSGSGSNLMYAVAVKWAEAPENHPAVIFPELYKEDNFGVTIGTVLESYNQAELTRWGIVFSSTVCEPEMGIDNCDAYNSYLPLNAKGQFGVKIIGLTPGEDYYTRIFAIYGSGEDAVTVYSDALEFTSEN